MPGPRPMPTHLKLLHGNPGKRPLNKNEPKPARADEPPEPPAFLSGFAAEEWRRISVEAYRLELLTEVDIMALAAYCDAYERWRTAKETVAAMAERDPVMHGLIVRTQSGGAAANPLVWIAANAARDMVRYAAEFGIRRAGIETAGAKSSMRQA